MLEAFLSTFGAVCPACRAAGRVGGRLELSRVFEQPDSRTASAIVQCFEPSCQAEFPVIDGVPLLVPDARGFVAANLHHLTRREPMHDEIENLLGDCAGTGTWFEHARQYLSTYGLDHYGIRPEAGQARRLLASMVEMAGGEIQGPALEIGCAAGGVTLELARLTGGPALGVDLFYPLVRLFQSMLATGHARVPLRRSGTVYDETEILLSEAQRECAGRVDGWCADGAMLPFADASVGVVVAINVLDVTASPLELLREMRRVLRPGGVLMVCTPYDWNAGATRMEAWLGGHSKRAHGAGDPSRVLEMLLTPGANAASLASTRLVASRHDVPWNVRVHDRHAAAYTLHAVVARAE